MSCSVSSHASEKRKKPAATKPMTTEPTIHIPKTIRIVTRNPLFLTTLTGKKLRRREVAGLAPGIGVNLQRSAGNHLDALLIERVAARIAQFNVVSTGPQGEFL
jgi:hypothetical protein